MLVWALNEDLLKDTVTGHFDGSITTAFQLNACQTQGFTRSYSSYAFLSSLLQLRPIGEMFIMPERNSRKVPLNR